MLGESKEDGEDGKDGADDDDNDDDDDDDDVDKDDGNANNRSALLFIPLIGYWASGGSTLKKSDSERSQWLLMIGRWTIQQTYLVDLTICIHHHHFLP